MHAFGLDEKLQAMLSQSYDNLLQPSELKNTSYSYFLSFYSTYCNFHNRF